jgi:hypothetical protein
MPDIENYDAPCICIPAESSLIWVDETCEYSGVTLTCLRCGRDVTIKSVPEMPPLKPSLRAWLFSAVYPIMREVIARNAVTGRPEIRTAVVQPKPPDD